MLRFVRVALSKLRRDRKHSARVLVSKSVGYAWATLLSPTVSPELPALVETNTLAAAALKKPISSGVTTYCDEPEIE